ncbi:MAG: hypothetical protein DI570_12865 [Phenylobacterium zucineum]|nr:MAG: hypothetical protein DI570_12865 [Phenylobacterium zucineum]
MRQINLRIGNTPGSVTGFGGTLYDETGKLGVEYGATVQSHQTVRGRYLQFNISGCNRAGAAYNGCGIGEVIFNSTTPAPVASVPEPAAWAMMIMGFGGIGAVVRRRNGRLATA